MIWKELETFGRYAFNKSHAAAYAVISYQTAYLKEYYPVNKRHKQVSEAFESQNIELLRPDINYSNALFTPQGDKIRYGLACIRMWAEPP